MVARPRIAITPGEPAGIGPDLCLRLVHQWQNSMHAEHADDTQRVFVADPLLLQQRARQLGLDLSLPVYDPAVAAPWSVLPVMLNTAAQAGHLNSANAGYVLESLRIAATACLRGEFQALVTGPVHKGIINDAGIPFTGHTEFLAELAACNDVVMMLATEGLRVALVTTHLPLRDVAAHITRERVRRSLEILHEDLVSRFGIARPVIGVCGLNPHAGEGGHLGREELEVIEPVLHELRQRGWQLAGPLPADTAFTRERLQQLHAVLAMYHDQGLPVLKHMGFGQAVNITLGLPFIRTSVDHGTALERAGSGDINDSSLRYALACAVDMMHASGRPA